MNWRFFLLGLLFFGCGKDKFETTPNLRLINVSDKVVPQNGTLRVRLEYLDKEGDVSDSIFVKKVRLNRRATTTVRDSLRFGIPDFPASSKGEIELVLTYVNLQSASNPPTIPNSNPRRLEPDTLNLLFYVRDNAKNKSDTVTVDRVIVFRD